MSTAGGQQFTIVGVVGIGTEVVSISIGSRVSATLLNSCKRGAARLIISFTHAQLEALPSPCCHALFVQPCTDVVSSIENNLSPSDPSASFTLSCTTPPGVGAGLPIVLKTGGGMSPVDNSFLFSYAPPVLLPGLTLLAEGNTTTPSALRRRTQVSSRRLPFRSSATYDIASPLDLGFRMLAALLCPR